jgi:hypothetical protein
MFFELLWLTCSIFQQGWSKMMFTARSLSSLGSTKARLSGFQPPGCLWAAVSRWDSVSLWGGAGWGRHPGF